jgi:uncharacterized membrane protein YhiD involved in acid resistance
MLGETTEVITGSFYNVSQIALNLLVACALGATVALTYRRTHHGLSYSQAFVVSLVFVSIIACGAIMVIGSNIARAFGLVGALSIIRYRTVVKDTRDASFIFLALVVGFACGTSSFLIGTLTTALVLGLALLVHKFRFGILKEHDFILSFSVPRTAAGANASASYQSALDQFCARQSLLHVESSEGTDRLQLTYDVSLREGIESTQLVQALATSPGVESPRLIFAKGDPNF